MKKEQVNLSLEEISYALAKADKGRMSPELSPEDREIMEQACVTLREAERQAIVNVETGLVERFQESADGVKLQAKNIRALVTKLNRIPKSLDITESVIKECIKVLKAVALWCTMFFLLVYLSGCASMSKAQLKRVNSLAVVSDSAVCGPGSDLTLTTMLVVGEAIDNRQGLSELYSKHFTHLFRQGDDGAAS